jgi:hypothetical protein
VVEIKFGYARITSAICGSVNLILVVAFIGHIKRDQGWSRSTVCLSPSRERQRARGGRAAGRPPTSVVEPGGVAGRRGHAQGLAPGVVVPDAAVAVRRGRADAPALRVIEPSLRLGACLIDREADDDCDQNSKQPCLELLLGNWPSCKQRDHCFLSRCGHRRRPDLDTLSFSFASWSLRPPCGVCYFAPNICSSLPWRQLPFRAA